MPSETTGPSRIGRLIVLCVPVLGVLSSTAARAEGELIERILAVVDGRPLMLTEVRLVERVKGLDRKTALETLIDERLMFREAARLTQAAGTVEGEEEAYLSLARPLDPSSVVSAEADLRRLAHRQLTILRYIESRFRPQIRIADEDVRRAYETRQAGRDAPPFEAAALEIRRQLADRELDERIEAWIRELRAGAEIRYNAPE